MEWEVFSICSVLSTCVIPRVLHVIVLRDKIWWGFWNPGVEFFSFRNIRSKCQSVNLRGQTQVGPGGADSHWRVSIAHFPISRLHQFSLESFDPFPFFKNTFYKLIFIGNFTHFLLNCQTTLSVFQMLYCDKCLFTWDYVFCHCLTCIYLIKER